MTITQPEIKKYLKSAVEVAKGAGIILSKYWGKLSNIEEKSHAGNLVTEADRESEKLIVDLLHQRYPTHAIYAEESGQLFTDLLGTSNEFIWIIDPLDGTTNYTHQFPMVSISIALIYKGEPIIGIVYNPILKDFFYAIQGGLTYMNGHPVQVSQVSKLENSLLVTGFAYDRRENPDNNYAEFCKLTHITQGVRRLGSAALDLAYVAAGTFDAYWERGLEPWDMAAGILLVQQAGGQVSGYDNAPFDLYSGRIIASNGLLHRQLSEALTEAVAKF